MAGQDQAGVLSLTWGLERDGVTVGEHIDLHLVVRVLPESGAIDGMRPTLSVVFALDTSGSMKGPPLAHVTESVTKLVALLNSDDRVGVVAFSNEATQVCALEPLTQDFRHLLRRRIHRLNAGGSTSIEAGLRRAASLFEARREGERQLIILLSDGSPNRGLADAEGLAGLAASLRPDIAVATLGFGAHHDEDLLEAIAQAGGGDYATIEDPQESDMEFARTLGAQGDVIADGLNLTVSPQEGVELEQVLSNQRQRIGAGGLTLTLPDLIEGLPQTVVARLSLRAPRASGPWEALTLTMRHRRAGRREVQTETHTVVIPVRHVEGKLDPIVHGRVLLEQANQARRRAREIADRGQFGGAVALLREMLKRLEGAPGYVAGDGSDLSEAAEQLLDEVMAYERRPDAESYRAFKRVAMGVDMQRGGNHDGDRIAVSARSVGLTTGVLDAAPQHAWLERDGQPPLRLGAECTIGRTRGNDCVIARANVSKRQARIVAKQGHYIIIDLKSTNGTYLNGRCLRAPQVLRDGDQIAIGDNILTFRCA